MWNFVAPDYATDRELVAREDRMPSKEKLDSTSPRNKKGRRISRPSHRTWVTSPPKDVPGPPETWRVVLSVSDGISERNCQKYQPQEYSRKPSRVGSDTGSNALFVWQRALLGPSLRPI